MADKKTRADLEILFSSGKIPTQSDFADFIASGISQKDDGLQKASDTALKVQAPVTVGTDPKAPRDLILFYEKIEDPDAKWRMRLSSGGLEISRGTQSDLLVDANGNVGIGADKPGAKLHVVGSVLFTSGGGPEFGAVSLGDANHGIKSTIGDGVTIFSYQVPIGIHLKQVTGNVGIGTNIPNAKLQIINQNQDANGNTLILGPVAQSHLRLGYNTEYNWIQSHGGKPLAVNPLGNNVGIGTTTPLNKLQVIAPGGFGSEDANGISQSGNVPIVAQSSSTAFGIINGSGRQAFALNIDGDGGTKTVRGTPTFYDKFDGNWHSCLCLKNGNVGIGTADVKAKLHVVDGAIMPAVGDGESAGILFPPDPFKGSGDRAYIRYYSRTGNTESMTLEIGNKNDADDHIALMSGGYVGIGTIEPRVPLEVKRWTTIPLTNSPDGFGANIGYNSGVLGLGTAGGGNFDVTILAENWIAGAGFVANSDRRIKEIEGLSDTAQDLEIIRKMRVADYRPLDKIAAGNSLRKGFIGQEVLEVFPQAVGKRTNAIPDVYRRAASFVFDGRQKTLSVILPEAHTLIKGEAVQIITEEGAKTATVVAVPTSESFVADKFEKEPQCVFVYGRQVDDFLFVDYDQIFSTGIGAIQELNKLAAARDAEVNLLQNENKALRRRLSVQDKRLTKLEAKEKTHNESRAVGGGQ